MIAPGVETDLDSIVPLSVRLSPDSVTALGLEIAPATETGQEDLATARVDPVMVIGRESVIDQAMVIVLDVPATALDVQVTGTDPALVTDPDAPATDPASVIVRAHSRIGRPLTSVVIG